MSDWKETLAQNVTEAYQLRDLMKLTPEQEAKMAAIVDRFPLLVPQYYLDLIDWDNVEHDPIRKLCIPSIDDVDMSGSFDTSGEESNTKLKGLQHKYHQTAMILSTSKCAMYCRFCFRKRLVGQAAQEEASSGFADIDAQFEYVKAHPEISNVLISGGDSFINNNDIIEYYLEKFSSLDQIDFIRFGTRVPVVFPMRIYEDQELLDILEKYNKIKQIFIITHFNHPTELTPEAKKAIQCLRERGLIIRNQTVLLRGVNDDGKILGQLLKELTACGIIPYYVFQCRPVVGVKAQFQVPILKGCDIIEEARAMQNGQGKSFRYAMSHPRGKLEFIGKVSDDEVVMKFHQAKYDEELGKIFTVKLSEDQAWLDDDLK